MQKIFYALLLVIVSISVTLQAHQPYSAEIIVPPKTADVDASSIVNLIQDLKEAALVQIVPVYVPEVTPVLFNINLRGILASASFAMNSTTLNVVIPQVGIVTSFTGATRDESYKLFRDFLHVDIFKNKNFLKANAKFSPIDPMAGNPNSLMFQMAQADYLLGRLTPLNGCHCFQGTQPIVHQFQAGLTVGRTFAKEFDTTIFTVPLRYSYSPCDSSAFIIDAPITLLKNGGAYSVVGSAGIGWQQFFTSKWSLTPIFRVGAGESLDLTTGGAFLSYGIVSNWNFLTSQNYVLSLTNSCSYCSSFPIHWGGVTFNYRVYDWIFRNGLVFHTCEGYCFRGRPLNFSLTFVDSVLSGSSLYMMHYDEVGINLIANHIFPCLEYDCLSVGFSYQFGAKNFKGYLANLVYQF